MNFLKIAGKDIKSIFKNRFIRVSVIAIIVVPLLYSLLYLDAFWDPYARLSELPVAVVNLDKGSNLDDEKVNYGEDVVDNLKNDRKLNWQFVTNEEADEGLEEDGYYAKFVIPEDFSKSVIAGKSGTPQVSNFKFVSNEKKNFLAAQINSQVEGLLKEQIVSTISNQYVTIAFENLYEVKDGLVEAADGSKQLYDGMSELNEKVPMLEDGTKQLAEGSYQLNDGQSKLNSAVSAVSTGLGTLSDKIPTLSNGVDQLYNGSTELKNGVLTAKDGSEQLANGSKSLYFAFNETIYPSVKKLQSGANELSLALESGKGNIEKLNEGAVALKEASDKISQSSSAVKDGYGQIKSGVDELIGGVNASSQTMTSVSEDLVKAMQSTDEKEKNTNIMAAVQKLQALQEASKDMPEKLTELKNGSEYLNGKLNEFDGGIKEYTGKVKEFATGTTSLTGSVSEVSNGINQISGGLNSLENGLNESTPGSFGNGLKAVSDNMSVLNDGLYKLNGGASQISEGLNSLKSNVPELSQGVTALYSGSKEIIVGSNALVDGQSKLNTGINELSAKVPELKDGVTKLHDGSEELKDKLDEGAKEIESGLVNSPETMGEFVGEPVQMNSEPINPIPNYGTGFAPYFIALSLWIGAIMMFFVIPSKTDDDENTSKFDKVVGKFLSFAFIGILQAILVSVVVMMLGLEPRSVPLYIGLTIFFSFVFISIIQCLIFLLGDAGRLLGIVLLILQLTACAGTFPLELVPNFFKVLNPFMPFTYVVESLREVISATVIDYSIITKDVVILAIVLVVFLTISVVFKNAGEKLQAIIEGKKEIKKEEIIESM